MVVMTESEGMRVATSVDTLGTLGVMNLAREGLIGELMNPDE